MTMHKQSYGSKWEDEPSNVGAHWKRKDILYLSKGSLQNLITLISSFTV